MTKGVEPIGIYFNLKKLKCHICGYHWFPRKTGEINNCPYCRSRDWNRGKKVIAKLPVIRCPRCAHKWSPYSREVAECPKCKQRIYRLTKRRKNN